MNAEQIVRFFTTVGDILEEVGAKEPYKILLIGGGYMITQVGNRAATKDIDCVFTSATLTSPEHLLFARAVAIALEDLSQEFPCEFTDSFGDHLQSVTRLPAGRLWLKAGMLEVSVPDDRYILALKLEAGREKDLDDIRALFPRVGISTRKEAQKLIAEFYHPWVRRGRSKQLRTSLDTVFRALTQEGNS